jgi:hypothetical protein
MIDPRLKYRKFTSGRLEVRCSTCNESPHSSTEEDDLGGTWHLPVCPTCAITLGRWPSIVAREKELEALLATR